MKGLLLLSEMIYKGKGYRSYGGAYPLTYKTSLRFCEGPPPLPRRGELPELHRMTALDTCIV